jgi:hypothetical protein
MKAIHLICHPTSLGWQDLQPVPRRPGVFISKCWILRDGDPHSLKSGWLSLHETSYRAAGFAARILNVNPCCTGKDLLGYRIHRGASRAQEPAVARKDTTPDHGGIVDVNFTRERDSRDIV